VDSAAYRSRKRWSQWERRHDPDQLAREQRIDEAAVDVEAAWEERTAAEGAVTDAEVAAAAAIERLLEERLAVKDIVQLTGLDQATVRRLRQLDADTNDGARTTSERADAEVAGWRPGRPA
jgi:predicted subunit of tRNA(5-methylaminomethyl-2-thiouridylate) methyltransferase